MLIKLQKCNDRVFQVPGKLLDKLMAHQKLWSKVVYAQPLTKDILKLHVARSWKNITRSAMLSFMLLIFAKKGYWVEWTFSVTQISLISLKVLW